MATKKNNQPSSYSLIPALKEDLASQIRDTIEAKRINKTEAAELTKISRARMSKICNGNIQNCTTDSLLEILVNLGHEIILEVKPIPPAKRIRLVGPNSKK